MATPLVKRLMKELQIMNKNPVWEYHAYPLEDNIQEWHFTMRGPEGCDGAFSGGLYHGKIIVPANYPYSPPDVVMTTPNGRFATDIKICLSITSYHPENWQSTWGIATVLTALRDFMLTPGNNGIGAVEYPTAARKELAIKSRSYVCPECQQSSESHLEFMDAAPPAGSPVAIPPATPIQPPAAATANDATPLGAVGSVSAPQPSPLTAGSPVQTGERVEAAPLTPEAAVTPPVNTPVAAQPAAPAPVPAPAPAPADPPAAAVRPIVAVQVQNRRVDVRLSLELVDKLLCFFVVVASLIVLKKLSLDVWREGTELHQWAVWVVKFIFPPAEQDTFPW